MEEPVDDPVFTGEARIDLTGMRRSYARGGITAGDLHPDPFAQFNRWLEDAVAAELVEPNAMTLATTDPTGHPSARTVLLKGVDHGTADAAGTSPGGFVFFTDYESRKGRNLLANPACALLFAWVPMARQVAVTGHAERLSAPASDAYFASRPRGSQIGAWTSHQSQVIGDREELETRRGIMERRFPGEVPRPPYWGGFRVVAREIEFWQGRPDRLHDRLRYRRRDDEPGVWAIERLAP
jgi:pyridoxamine 5'-phosphate oxidase